MTTDVGVELTTWIGSRDREFRSCSGSKYDPLRVRVLTSTRRPKKCASNNARAFGVTSGCFRMSAKVRASLERQRPRKQSGSSAEDALFARTTSDKAATPRTMRKFVPFIIRTSQGQGPRRNRQIPVQTCTSAILLSILWMRQPTRKRAFAAGRSWPTGGIQPDAIV